MVSPEPLPLPIDGQGHLRRSAPDLPLRVLIVDDDTDIHRLLRVRLEARGHEVSSATSGEDGIRRLREVHPDLVFLDFAMSGMSQSCGCVTSSSFVTRFHARLDVPTATLRYVDAGHRQVVLRRASSATEILRPWDLPLGALSSERYHAGAVVLYPGDALVIDCDGLTRARPDPFTDPLTVAAQVNASDSAGAIAQALVDLASGHGPLPDDLTVVVRRTPAQA